MADKQIGALPEAASIDDASLFVTEQQEQAMRVSGSVLKGYARAAVAAEVTAANKAAAEAQAARQAIEDMTVSAVAADAPGVTKTVSPSGAVNLEFGLVAGPEGPRGPKGDTGKGLVILGRYDSLEALSAAVPAPGVGDAYSVGMAAPYDVCIWDGAQWVNNGGLQGADGQDGATFTPSVSAEGVLSWENDGGRENPAAVNLRGPQGPAGTDGAAGPNRVTTATATTLTGLLKGSGGTVQAAAAGTDYVAPVSGTAGNVVVFGAGGALADSGRAVGEIGGGGGWKTVLFGVAETAATPASGTHSISPAISVDGNMRLEVELEVYGLSPNAEISVDLLDSNVNTGIAGGVSVTAGSTTKAYGKSKNVLSGKSKRITGFLDTDTGILYMGTLTFSTSILKIDQVSFRASIGATCGAILLRYRLLDADVDLW